MPCPFQHEGEPPQTDSPRNPFDWIRDWYLRDINLSRRVGWSGPTHDAFVAPFGALYNLVNARYVQGSKYDSGRPPAAAALTSNDIFTEGLARFHAYNLQQQQFVQGSKFDPGPKPAPNVLPTKDVSFTEQLGYELSDYPGYPLQERAIAEVFKPEVGMGPVLPGGTPSGIPREPGTSGGTPSGGGYGFYQFMTDTFREARDLITPSAGSGGIPAFRQADPTL